MKRTAKPLLRRPSHILVSILVVCGFGIVGAVLLVTTHASTPVVSIEPENGTPSGVKALTDTSASGGKATQFIPATPLDTAMPVGDITGWHQTFSDDFTTPAALGTFKTVYGTKWRDYGDPSLDARTGVPARYSTSKTVSVGNGILSIHDHYDATAGLFYSDALLPSSGGKYVDQLYGRYSLRFRALNPVKGYKFVPLLWAQSNVWADGEVDFPEGDLSSTFSGYNHCVGNPSVNCYQVHPGVTFANWHIATIEWKPGQVNFILDGQLLGSTTKSTPSVPMHYVIQNEACFDSPANTSDNCPTNLTAQPEIQVDWVTIYSYTP